MAFDFFEPLDADRSPATGGYYLTRAALLGGIDRLDVIPDPDRSNFALVVFTPARGPMTTWIAPALGTSPKLPTSSFGTPITASPYPSPFKSAIATQCPKWSLGAASGSIPFTPCSIFLLPEPVTPSSVPRNRMATPELAYTTFPPASESRNGTPTNKSS